MPESDTMLFCVVHNGNTCADQSSIKCKSAKGKQGSHRIFHQLIPILQVMKNLCSQETKDGCKNYYVSYPVVRPNADLALLRFCELMLFSFPPFKACKQNS